MSYNDFYKDFQSLMDNINHDSDIVNKLKTITHLYKESQRLLIAARDEAAYEIRQKYCASDAAVITGYDRKYIDYWAKRWMVLKDLPKLKRIKRQDLSNAIDLSKG